MAKIRPCVFQKVSSSNLDRSATAASAHRLQNGVASARVKPGAQRRLEAKRPELVDEAAAVLVDELFHIRVREKGDRIVSTQLPKRLEERSLYGVVEVTKMPRIAGEAALDQVAIVDRVLTR